ncbi:zeta toxin family protein [Furfurilactobacillus milii]|uniref:UDP-N-acetylglucosamine kinase n=1 Tax=Furfurilactobacillus milii TaxID=2888272 RepID=A0A6N9I3P5_9LACO|nr:zeta toxin family protein [Furfurilactobacillus milii]MYV17508.1 AAA family ATPase [Furfurilactobacillus milii]
MTSPVLLIIAGVNGAGKSTLDLTLEKSGYAFSNFKRINVDDIVRQQHSDWRDSKAYLAAFRTAAVLFRQYVSQKQSFIWETTLAGHPRQEIEFAKANGFKVEVRYVGLSSPDIAIRRVHKRVRLGGHGVEDSVVRTRYEKSLKHLVQLSDLFDGLEIIDNTNQMLETIYMYSNELKVLIDERDGYDWAKKLVFNV